MSLTTNPTLTLEGLKEGVQGMSRMLAAGLSMGTTEHSHSKHDPNDPSHPRGSFARHTPRESNSSTATTSTGYTFTSRLSVASSSATSLEDVAFGSSPSSKRGPPHDSPQELIINDTGATPTWSPNPAFLEQKERRRRREEEELKKSPSTIGTEVEEDAWDAWGDFEGGEEQVVEGPVVKIMDAPKSTRTVSGSVPPASSIPSLGAATQSIAGLTALATPQVTSWMQKGGSAYVPSVHLE